VSIYRGKLRHTQRVAIVIVMLAVGVGLGAEAANKEIAIQGNNRSEIAGHTVGLSIINVCILSYIDFAYRIYPSRCGLRR
jgi:hypothetical protein